MSEISATSEKLDTHETVNAEGEPEPEDKWVVSIILDCYVCYSYIFVMKEQTMIRKYVWCTLSSQHL